MKKKNGIAIEMHAFFIDPVVNWYDYSSVPFVFSAWIFCHTTPTIPWGMGVCSLSVLVGINATSAQCALSLRAICRERKKNRLTLDQTAKTAAKFNFHPICYFRNVWVSMAKNPTVSLNTKNDIEECKLNRMQILTKNLLNWKWRRWRRMCTISHQRWSRWYL